MGRFEDLPRREVIAEASVTRKEGDRCAREEKEYDVKALKGFPKGLDPDLVK